MKCEFLSIGPSHISASFVLTETDGSCQQCAGKGKRIARLCPRCKGNKVLDTQHTLAVHIPAGAPEGFEEVFSGEADESTEWEAGDVVVRVRSQKKDGQGGWGRKENGIVGRVVLSVAEALLGFERTMTHLDGRTIPLSRKGTTQPNEVEVIEGEGVSLSLFLR
jgi:DnaJ-related protein SCJ1